VSELAQHGTDYAVVELEPASTVERNLAIGSRLWASALVFFFFAFLFAYFYLRSLNEHGLFKPKGVTAPQGWGIAITVCLVVSAGLLHLGAADQRADRRSAWRLKGLAALLLGLAAVVLQIIAWASIGFGPTDGGYASVYLGWTGLYAIFVFCTLYWLETCLALSYRYRGEPFGKAEVEPGHASGDPYREAPDIANPVHLDTAEVAALTFTWTTLVAIGVVTWFILYVI
jgi:heme/copper-type cytochrome/quinol oxidase subunit 3